MAQIPVKIYRRNSGDITYKELIFTSSITYTIPDKYKSMDVFLVGGGGSGGSGYHSGGTNTFINQGGSGGGAGYAITETMIDVSSNKEVTVSIGNANQDTILLIGSQTITASKGGTGRTPDSTNVGQSIGGGASNNGGGATQNSISYSSGGANSPGGSGVRAFGNPGGTQYGGGGGAAYSYAQNTSSHTATVTGSAGGAAGGGAGSSYYNYAGSGAANTGGGGGGGAANGGVRGVGGSGIVIIRLYKDDNR